MLDGLKWVLSFQNSDGGFPSFEKDVSKTFFKMITLYDPRTPDFSDLSQVDVSARILKMLSRIENSKYARMIPADVIKNTCQYLKENHVDKFPYIWEGRWFIAYGYGTAEVINGLLSANCVNVTDVLPNQSLDYLISKQNADGGWGEKAASFAANTYIIGKSTMMQTSYIVQALLTFDEKYFAAKKTHSKYYLNIIRAIEFLQNNIADDGSINEQSFAGVVAKGMFYTNYELDPYFMSLRAINRYQNLQRL